MSVFFASDVEQHVVGEPPGGLAVRKRAQLFVGAWSPPGLMSI